MKIVDSFSYQEIKGFKFGQSIMGKPKLYSHIYYIDGMLIDTGHRRMGEDVLDLIKDLEVDKIFITHYHEDHSGNIYLLQKHFDCPVYASQLCSEIMKAPPRISLSQKMTWGDRPPFHTIIPIQRSIKTKKYKFEIIDIPGHAIDMVALYEPNNKWLFSADLYVNSYIGYFLKEESMIQQILSIKNILELDFDVLLCGHNPQFTRGKEKLTKKLKFLESFYNDVSSEYKKGKNAHQIFKSFELKEFKMVRYLSGGALSKMNMVKAVIRDLQ